MDFSEGADGGILSSPLIKGVVAMLFITAGGMGLAYGFATGKFKNDSDVMNGMAIINENAWQPIWSSYFLPLNL